MGKTIQEITTAVANAVIAQTTLLNELDAIMGDGEHGSNMNKCFSAVLAGLPQWNGKKEGEILEAIGKTLLSAGGGTATTLMGFGLVKLSRLPAIGTNAAPKALANALKEVLADMRGKSKAQLGDKTMMDALVPCVEAFSATAENGAGVAQCWRAASEAAQGGAGVCMWVKGGLEQRIPALFRSASL